jgi:anti-sigma factor RsiW
MQECREVIDLLTEYLEGGLPAAEARRLERHLAGCDACAGFLESLKTVRAAAGTPKADSLPEECHTALRSFLRERLERGSKPKRPRR